MGEGDGEKCRSGGERKEEYSGGGENEIKEGGGARERGRWRGMG